MEKPKNVIVPAVGALALGLWAGLSACSQQPGNQTQQSMQQSQSGDQQQARQPQSGEQQPVQQSKSGQPEAQPQQPQSADQQPPQTGGQQQAEQQPPQSGQPEAQQLQSAGQQQRAQQPQSGEQQAEQQPPQSGEQQRAEQLQTGEQHAQQPHGQNNNRQIASNGQNETATLNLNRDQIEQVQRALNQKGFKAGRADGKMGPQTESAVRSFQQQQKLQASGQIDQQTLVALGLNNLTQSTAGQGGGRQQPAARQE